MEWIIIFVSVIFSAFFSGMEIAFISSNKLRLEIASKEAGLRSRILTVFNNNQPQFISAMLVGNNLVLVIYGIFMAKLLQAPIESFVNNEVYILIIQTILSTLIILVFAEFLPKTLFRIISNKALTTFSVPLIFFYYLFYPVVVFSMWISSRIMSLFISENLDQYQKERAFGKIDIDEIIDKSTKHNEKTKEAHELKIFQNAMDFSSVKLRECIVPRNEIQAVSINMEISELKEKFIETGHSNILVYRDNVDEISGYVNVKDIFKNPQKLRNFVRQVMIVPETMSAKKLFEQLIKSKKSLAIVVDEFGSTSGMVTVEDILEEIFGEFEDEHDTPEINAVIDPDGNYVMSGRMELDDFNEEFGFQLSESDDYETIAGYILFHYGSFPNQSEIINIKDGNRNYKFKILKIQDTKIEKIMLFDE
ncbi:MAG: hemolysin family protein [Bacteroidales bacterium]|nr:hemolysin family protein [Bacteroidales bacterium]MDD4216511.1 hemolysin family protein [Bacteroidales bacterium]MDY0141459.1 hemolysin family protein [Bacteroidales bacterium]